MALRKYAVGGLQGCLISVTGVAFDERSKICEMVQELGGIYSPDLRPQCSHLIYEAAGTGSSQTSQSLQSVLPIKVQYALKWDIPVISKDWIYACYNKKMLLEEADFPACHVSGVADESVSSIEILPVSLSDIQENTPSFLTGCHVYLTGDSISAQKMAVLKRIVLAAGGVRYTDLESENLTHIVIHNQLLLNNLNEFLDKQSDGCEVKLVHDNWLFDSFKEGKRLSEDDYEVNKKTSTSSQPQKEPIQKWKSAFNNAGSNASNANGNNSHNGSFLNANVNISYGTPRTSLVGGEEFLAGTPNVMESASTILKGKSVYFGSLSTGSRVQKLLSKAKRAEVIIVDNELEADWCITNVIISNDLYKKLTLHRSPNEIRNEIWFEAALDSKSHIPSMNFAYPLICPAPIPLGHFRKFIISQSGFTGAEREFYTEMIKLSGAQYTDSLSKTNTHLLIREPRSGTKFEFAKKWKIECIDLNWFKDQLKQTDQRIERKDLEAENSVLLSIKTNSQLSQLSQVKLSFQSVLNETQIQIPSQTAEIGIGGLFKGLVFASSQRLWHRRDELSHLIESLGGVFLWSFDQTCTHYLHQGKLIDEAFKEFKQARQWDKFIVSPWWIVKCKENGKRLDEFQFPHTFKPTSETSEMSEKITRIDDDKTELQVKNPTSQTNLDWNAIMAQRKAQELLLRPGSKTFNIEGHPAFLKSNQETNSTKLTLNTLINTLPHQYKIVFSGYNSTEKAELIKIISNKPEFRAIGDEETFEWNPKSTILICQSLNFTEKIFSACATGSWILRKEFLLDQSSNEGNFSLNFEKYELGPAWNANERDTLIGKAPKYWRQRLAACSTDLRPFVGWKCALIVESSRQSLYESVLRNGGAEIIPVSSLSSTNHDLSQISHFFCANVKAIPENFRKQLKSTQVFPTKHITNTIFRLND